MPELNALTASSPSIAPARVALSAVQRRLMIGMVLGLALGFGLPLAALMRFAVPHSLYSHLPLVPVISAYLLWRIRQQLVIAPAWRVTALLPAAGAAALLVFSLLGPAVPAGPVEDRLAVTTAAFVLAVGALAAGLLHPAALRAAAFPLVFLVFLIPLPAGWLASIDLVLQHGSAYVADTLFRLYGTPVHFEELTFQLPTIQLRVAPECSGVHSSLALLIVSVLAAYSFVRSPWRGALLPLAVLPLALLRNGTRIFVIGELCVQRGPEMIESWVHRNGGPVFFAASLIPMAALVWLVVRSERRA